VRHRGGERLVAGQPGWPGPRAGRGSPQPGQPGADTGKVALAQPEGREGLAALVGERGDPVAVARIADRPHRRVDVVEGQRGTLQPAGRPLDAQVGEESVALKGEPEARLARGGRQVENRLPVVRAHPAGQAAVVLAQQRVDQPGGQRALGRGRLARAHGRGSVISQFPVARMAATDSSTAAGSAPMAQISPR
jgi:hypothetical protein